MPSTNPWKRGDAEDARATIDTSLVAYVVIAALMALLVLMWSRAFDTGLAIPYPGVADDR